MGLPLSLYIVPTDGERLQDWWSCRRQWNLPPKTTDGMDPPLSLYRHSKWSGAIPLRGLPLVLQTVELVMGLPLGWTYPLALYRHSKWSGAIPLRGLPLVLQTVELVMGLPLGWTYPLALFRHTGGEGAWPVLCWRRRNSRPKTITGVDLPLFTAQAQKGNGVRLPLPPFYCTSTEGGRCYTWGCAEVSGTRNQRQPLPPFYCTKHRWGGQARPRNQRPPPLPPFNWSNTDRVDGQDLWLHWRRRNSTPKTTSVMDHPVLQGSSLEYSSLRPAE